MELSLAELGDLRLRGRLGQIADALQQAPSDGLPKAMRTTAALEAAYRFMSNRRVTPQRILDPHIEGTIRRAVEEQSVIAIHDTTEFEFRGEQRQGLGRLTGPGQGFVAHVALAVGESGLQPLGVVGLATYARLEPPSTKKDRMAYAYRTRDEKEANRWWETVSAIQVATAGRAKWIHVADREADCYRMLVQIVEGGDDFVIRARHDRALEGTGHLKEAVRSAVAVLERDVSLSPRKGKRTDNGELLRGQTNLPRRARIARLSVAATTVSLRKSWALPTADFPACLDVNAVRVYEEDPPEDEPAVEWILLTTLPVKTPKQIERIVDIYRARWLIEEFFKALKTGCRYEQMQLESYSTLTNALAIVLPVAWQMLLLRQLSREAEAPASAVLTSAQLQVLKALSPAKLSSRPTSREALMAIAALGGHIRNNGDPGWLVLYRGFRDLMMLELGWLARCDQS
jgi:Transposase DNA-binding/Transposase DDE domain